MPNRTPVSEETKKKISEALKKGSSAKNVSSTNLRKTNDPEMNKLRNSFDNAQMEVDDARVQIENIKSKLPEKKSGQKKTKAQKAGEKKQREQARDQVKVLKEKIKAAVAKQKEAKKQAQGLKRVKKAQETIKKANEGIKKATALKAKIEGAIAKREIDMDKKKLPINKKKGETVEQKQTKKDKVSEQRQALSDRLQAINERVNNITKTHEARKAQAQKIINSKGIVPAATDNFSFSENESCVNLYERKVFVKWREFNLFEKRVNFEYLNQEFNDLEGELEMSLHTFMDEEIESNVQRIKNKIRSGDLAGISALSIMNIDGLAKILLNYSKQSFEVGKKSASEEMDVSKYATPKQITIILNFEALETATTIVNQMNSVIRQRAKEEIVKKDIEVKFAEVEIGSFIDMEAVKKIAERLRNELVGSLIGQKVNQGRRFVFEKNSTKLKAYRRTEYLDFRICKVCQSLNGKYVDLNDPFSKLDKVHTNCRGFWMPVLNFDNIDGDVGLPKKLIKAFDLISGFPMINGFKQIKKII